MPNGPHTYDVEVLTKTALATIIIRTVQEKPQQKTIHEDQVYLSGREIP